MSAQAPSSPNVKISRWSDFCNKNVKSHFDVLKFGSTRRAFLPLDNGADGGTRQTPLRFSPEALTHGVARRRVAAKPGFPSPLCRETRLHRPTSVSLSLSSAGLLWRGVVRACTLKTFLGVLQTGSLFFSCSYRPSICLMLCWHI